MPSLFSAQEYSSLEAPREAEDKPFLGSATMVAETVRAYLGRVTEANERYLSDEIDQAGLLAEIEVAAAPYVAGFNGQAPESFQTTPFHSPGSLGAYLRQFGDFANTNDEAIEQLFFQMALSLLNLITADAGLEEDEGDLEGEIDELVRTYTALLMGITAPPTGDEG
jgi:hypothetical protein